MKHDLQVPENALDLALELAFLSDVEKWYDEITQAVIDVRMC